MIGRSTRRVAHHAQEHVRRDALAKSRWRALIHKFTMRIGLLEPQKLRILAELFNRNDRQRMIRSSEHSTFRLLAARRTWSNPGRRAAPLREFSAAFPSVLIGGLAVVLGLFLDPEASLAALLDSPIDGGARRRGTAGPSCDSRARCGLRARRRGRRRPAGSRRSTSSAELTSPLAVLN